MTWALDTISGPSFTFGSFSDSPKCRYNFPWVIRRAPGGTTYDNHLRHIPGVADVDKTYEGASQECEAGFGEQCSEGYRAGCTAQEAHDQKHIESYRPQLNVARAQITFYEQDPEVRNSINTTPRCIGRPWDCS
jgi:hypothetical protein